MTEKRLKKSISNRMLCGVCGGIGEYFNIDPTVIRLIWTILSFCSFGSGVVVYILAAIIIPET